MKFSLFMTIAAVVGLVFGLGFLILPDQLMSAYGVDLGEAGSWVARYLGSAFIGIGVLTLLARNAGKSEALDAILTGSFVLAITGLIVAFLDGINGVSNSLTWFTVVIYVYLTVGFGYFRFMKSD